ncbi:hypothetical protein L249_6102 [Ophiocordyceps polyrhachis-furcata BCC 54312]|uniref:YAG7-like dimerisation domain-containing protein n=1 Tax=Ophiocordyceps polyrhachis-furcata BCC 54312 TaxID=1330021 RepID=A0A367LJ60_9HYPO|nr:hypothetical protein L249_6102 [Ophiocordyceps polyrhachis-furcata BCC 54312]
MAVQAAASKKKVAKATESAKAPELAKAPEPAHSPTPSTASGVGDKSQDDGNEMPIIKDLQKNIRNLTKKITNASKTDSLLAQHSNKSLDDLVASKVINTDQKAQILKKPALQEQLAQTEEKLAQFRQLNDHYRLRAKMDKAEWEKSLEKAKDEAMAETRQNFDKSLRDHLLVLSQFLRLAAYRREEAKDLNSDESQAIEGVLLAIYSGDESAVGAMLKLIEGSKDSILSVPGQPLETTFASVKALAQDYKTPFYSETAPAVEPEPEKEVASVDPPAAADSPPVANAAAAEKDATESASVNGQDKTEPLANGTAHDSTSDDAVNAVTTAHSEGTHDESSVHDWVNLDHPRDSPEKEEEAAAASQESPVMANNTRSWADEQPDAVVEPTTDFTKFSATEADRSANPARGGEAALRAGAGAEEKAGVGGEGAAAAAMAECPVLVSSSSLSSRVRDTMAVSPRRWRPAMALLLGAMLMLSSGVAGAVLGVDLGTEYIKAALVKPGIPLDIVLTKDSRRKETSAVAFKPPRSGVKEGVFPERVYGADAMAIAARFPGEVYPNLKTLLGLPMEDEIVRDYATRHPALQMTPHPSRRTAVFRSKTVPETQDAWTVEELLAMELQSVQKNAEAAAGDGTSVRSVVLTVPPFYTVEEKRAVQTAAELAGLKVLGLMSDGLAVGLNYATSRQFPNINEGAKPEYHLVFDMGAGSTSATVMRFQGRTVKDLGKFNKTVQEVQVLGAGWDRTLGGDALNYLIMDDMISRFAAASGGSVTAEAVRSHGRAMASLAREAERARQVLSANQETSSSFEGLYDDRDFRYKLTRAEFEDMAEAYGQRVGQVIRNAVDTSKIALEDLTSVILHGGATRTPFVQRALEQAFGSADKLRSNVNADEAAVFGAGFRAAELSPSFRVKEIRISEGPMYPVGIKWTANSGKELRQRLWTATSPMGGPAKEMTLTEQKDVEIGFYQQVASEAMDTKTMKTKNLTATVAAMKEQYPSCIETDVAFRLALGLSSENGEVQVVKAAVECEAEVPEKGFVDGVKNLLGLGKKDQKDQQPLTEGGENMESQSTEGSEEDMKTDKDESTSTGTETAESASSAAAAEAAEAKSSDEVKPEGKAEVKKRREVVSIPVAFTLENAGPPSLTKADLTKIKDRLKAFAASDKARMQREETLNQLEGYTYKVRDLLEGEAFTSMSTEQERSKLADKASETSDWLYDGGSDATKEELKAKLKMLQDLVAPIQTRVDEAEKRPTVVSLLRASLNQTGQMVSGLRKQLSEHEQQSSSASASATPSSGFDGLEDSDSAPASKDSADKPLFKKEDVDEVEALRDSTAKWLDDMESRQAALPPTADPVLLTREMTEKKLKLDKAGMDLALKGVRSFESKAKKAGKGKVKFSDGSGKMSDEELERMMEKIKTEATDKLKRGKDGGGERRRMKGRGRRTIEGMDG